MAHLRFPIHNFQHQVAKLIISQNLTKRILINSILIKTMGQQRNLKDGLILILGQTKLIYHHIQFVHALALQMATRILKHGKSLDQMMD